MRGIDASYRQTSYRCIDPYRWIGTPLFPYVSEEGGLVNILLAKCLQCFEIPSQLRIYHSYVAFFNTFLISLWPLVEKSLTGQGEFSHLPLQQNTPLGQLWHFLCRLSHTRPSLIYTQSGTLHAINNEYTFLYYYLYKPYILNTFSPRRLLKPHSTTQKQ